MKNMMQWEKLILETVQLGGTLIFFKDLMNDEVAAYVEAILNLPEARIPVVLRTQKDFLSGAFRSRPEDLIVLMSSQVSVLAPLNAVLQGQRICLTAGAVPVQNPLLDATWTSCDLPVWRQAVQNVFAALDKAMKVAQWEGSHQAPCLFLDRDDVVVKNVPYNKNPELVELMPGITELIQRAHGAGYWVALVTNQSGLGRGWITWAEYQKVHQQMLRLLAAQGCWLDECVWAGFYEKEPAPAGLQFAGLRKPRGGMFQQVQDKLKVNLAASVMVGDSATDIVAAHGMGLKKLYLFRSEKVAEEKNKISEVQKSEPALQYSVITNFSEVLI
ncbi:MAG TPA: HAD-IIIA family hydrolase [Bdellovibrio sp.]